MEEPKKNNTVDTSRKFGKVVWIIIALFILGGATYYIFNRYHGGTNAQADLEDTEQVGDATRINGDTPNISLPDGKPNMVSAQSSILDTLAGTWVGSAYQSDIKESWTISFNNKNGRYEIKYPSIGCGGGWKLTNKNKSSWTFQETLRYGKDSCTNYGFIVLKYVNGKKLKYSYYYPDMSILSAEGFLDKK